jgi:hypothetical protein
MTASQDQERLVHIFLLEAAGGEAPPDLADRVLRRTFDAASAPARWRIPAMAAAAILVLVVGAWAIFSIWSYPSPVASGDYRLVEGGKLQRGAVIGTGQDASLVLGGYCRLDIGPDSRLRLQGLKKAEEVYLEKGSATCEVDRNIGTFVVRTDVGTVSVTGTKFTVRVEEGEQEMLSKQLFVKVLVGTVILSGAWGNTALTAGQEKAVSGAKADPPDVMGNITKVGEGFVTLQTNDGNAVNVTINNDTKIVIAGKPANISDLKVGMHGYAWVKPGKPATKFYAHAPAAPSTGTPANPEPKADVFGTITKLVDGSMTLQKPNSTETTTVTFNDATVVLISGKTVKYSDLKVGMHAAAWVKEGKPATKVYAYVPKPPSTTTPPAGSTEPKADGYGTITQVGASSFTLQKPNSTQTVVVSFNDSTVVVISGKDAKPSDLKVGMHSAVWVKPGKPATKVVAYVPTNK